MVACRLLAGILGPEAAGRAIIEPEVCRACCRSFEPSDRDFNPVIASLVWNAADAILSPLSPGENRQHWLTLQARAEASLPALFPNEEDLPLPPSSVIAGPEKLTLEEIVRVLPAPAVRSGQVTEWAVGFTTAPRRSPTLTPSLRSLLAAGWTAPHLFVDGEMELDAEFDGLSRTVRCPAAGARQSYFLALAELLQRFPAAQALMLVQDDAFWPGHLPMREYLEECLWPGAVPGLVSAWCCSDDTAPEAGWNPIHRPWKFGAVAFIFPRGLAEQFVHDPAVQRLCSSRPENPSGGLSMLIGDWADRVGIPVYFPTPSLVQHLGDVSTLYEHSRAVGVRRASRFLGDEVQATRPSDR